MSKPMNERESRLHLLEHARKNGYEQPLLDIFKKVDEAMKNAKSKEEKDIIALQGLMEVDSYYRGSSSNLSGMTLQGAAGNTIKDETIKKVIGTK